MQDMAILLYLAAGAAVVSVIWGRIEIRKVKSEIIKANQYAGKLSGIIADAGEMLEELNNFSDYIVTRIDLKNRELWDSLKRFDERIKAINMQLSGQSSFGQLQGQSSSGRPFKLINAAEERLTRNSSINTNSNRATVVAFSSKYHKVIELASVGYDETEIARRLKMGKGEIQLVLGLKSMASV